jgi:hypothetical protein
VLIGEGSSPSMYVRFVALKVHNSKAGFGLGGLV